MIDQEAARQFLTHQRLAVAGASDATGNFGATIYGELRRRGYDAVAVNPNAETVAGDPCYPSLASVPGTVDGVIVMVGAANALGIVEDAAAAGIARVWLFKGIGSSGTVSDEVVARCHELGLEVIAGACPLMFLEPVGWFHRLHRRARVANRSLSKAS